MSKDGAVSTDNARATKTYKFSVDGKKLESQQAVLAGAQIKAMAQIDPATALFLEGGGSAPDQLIADTVSVDLSKPGREHFYTMPAATFGAR